VNEARAIDHSPTGRPAPGGCDQTRSNRLSTVMDCRGTEFLSHTHPIPTENPVGIPTGSQYPQNPKILHTHTRTLFFSLQDTYFNLLFVTLTVGYYMMYVLRESVCD